ncbi:hypothetical protein V8G54_037200, partial [Vigna mungo]
QLLQYSSINCFSLKPHSSSRATPSSTVLCWILSYSPIVSSPSGPPSPTSSSSPVVPASLPSSLPKLFSSPTTPLPTSPSTTPPSPTPTSSPTPPSPSTVSSTSLTTLSSVTASCPRPLPRRQLHRLLLELRCVLRLLPQWRRFAPPLLLRSSTMPRFFNPF